MHLSISSSSDRLPVGHWPKVWLASIFLCVLFVGYFEVKLRSLGWIPSVVDSKELWSQERLNASLLGDEAIILVGTSRMQLDMDLSVVKDVSKLEPVQLAIDGSPFIQVLENLANDKSVTGTVIISVTMRNMMNKAKSKASDWVAYYRQKIKNEVPYEIVNKKVSAFLDQHMVTRLEGAKPETVISNLAFQQKSLGNYLITHNDRSRHADYQKVEMPLFYAMRLQRHYGKTLKDNAKSFDDFFQNYHQAIIQRKPNPANIPKFIEGVAFVKLLVNKIEARGGKVILVRFPSSKLIWEYDKQIYPKEIYWKIIKQNFVKTIHFDEHQSLKQFDLPDGSHMDYRDKKQFTKALMDIIYEK